MREKRKGVDCVSGWELVGSWDELGEGYCNQNIFYEKKSIFN